MKKRDKKAQAAIPEETQFGTPDEENPEWTEVDFARARPNRFARHFVTLDEDVVKYFPSSKAVNDALRLVIQLSQQVQPA